MAADVGEYPVPITTIDDSSETESENNTHDEEDEECRRDVCGDTGCVDAPPASSSDRKYIFNFTILNGYSFRHLFEFSKRIFREMPLVFSRNGITTAMCSSNRQIIMNAIIRREDVPFFYIDANAVNMPSIEACPEWYHVVNVDTLEMFDHVRNVVKKDGVKIYQYRDSPQTIEVTIFGTKAQSKSISVKPYTPVSYHVADETRRPVACPNLSVPISKFCGSLSRLLRSKTGKYMMKVFANGIIFVSSSDQNHCATFCDNGDGCGGASSPEGSPIISTIITPHVMTAFAKIANFSRDGAIKFYCAGANVVRVEAPIGSYGTLRFFISSVSHAQSQVGTCTAFSPSGK